MIASLEGRRGEPWPKPPTRSPTACLASRRSSTTSRPWPTFPRSSPTAASGSAAWARRPAPAPPSSPDRQGAQHRPGRDADGHHAGELIFDIGAGFQTARNSRRCKPADRWAAACRRIAQREGRFRLPARGGAIMGSGGMIVVDEDICMVEFSKFFLTFAQAESCGKCVPAASRQTHARSAHPHSDGRASWRTWTRCARWPRGSRTGPCAGWAN